MMRMPGTSRGSISRAYSVSSARARGPGPCPAPSRYSSAAPRPMAAAMSGVPASNFQGTSLKVVWRRWTSRIISPPPMNGGIASSSSRRAHSTPEPVGPSALWPEKTIEVGADLLHIHGPVGHGLGAVDEHQGAGGVGLGGHLADGVDGAQRVRDLVEGDQLRARAQQHLERLLVEPA